MNLIEKSFVVVYAIVCYSCNNNFVTHKINQQISPLFKMTDSLSDVFLENQFKVTIDTFKLAGKELPKSISIIEYYGINSDEQRNMKCLILRYGNNIGVFCLFKYSTAVRGWQLIGRYRTSSVRLKEIESEILSSNYWNEYKDNGAIPMWGDKARYIVLEAYEKKQTPFIKYINNPDMKMLDMFIDFTVSLKNEKYN